MKKITSILVIMLLFWSCGGDSSRSKELTVLSNSVSTSVDIEFINEVGLNSSALDIALSSDGKFAYIASGDSGLHVLDISNPQYPELIGTHDTYGYVNHVEVIGNIAYVSFVADTWDNYESINAFNVRYPYDIEYLGYHEGYKSNNHQNIEIYGKYIFIANQSLYVSSLDGNHQNSYRLFTPYALAVNKGFVYVANGIDGISILKIDESSTGRLVY